MSGHNPHDFWPKEREGFSDTLRPAYAAVRVPVSPRRISWLKLEERVGAVIAGAGLCWAANIVVNHFTAVSQFGQWPSGPLEVCALGVLVWMHAKWRRLVKVE